ncbi:hypothetical protein RND81_02G090700 [Saponaria officinalis]|uniref:Uncharacterized protein n=1 Tax=Saponaria officinalis TaxID=3572 RepID=A0AAW1MTF0_SAPOF
MFEVTYKYEKMHFSAEEISAMVLTKMKMTAEAYLGSEVKNVVLTVPAYFNDSQRRATKDAGTIAGLNVIQIISEPIAAAIAYGLDMGFDDSKVVKRNVLLFDLGSETLDVSLVTLDKDVVQVKAVSGDAHFGGRDLDNRLVSHCAAEFKSKHNKDINKNLRSLGRLRAACESAKKRLSVALKVTIEIDCLCDGIDFCYEISCAEFESLNMDLFSDCLKHVESCLGDAKMRKGEIDKVVLVGGSTRIPKVQRMLQDVFDGKEFYNSLNPEEVIAFGAAIHAAVLTGVLHNRRQMFIEVTPPSPGTGKHISLGTKSDDVETTDIPSLLEGVDSLLKEFGDSKESKTIEPFPPGTKNKVVEVLSRLKLDAYDIQLVQNLSLLLNDVAASLPEHLQPALRGLEQTLVTGQHRLLERAATKKATYIGPQETASLNSDLTASKRNGSNQVPLSVTSLSPTLLTLMLQSIA